MATIQQRGNSYFITVSCGLDVRGKQVRQTKTWRIPENMTAKQAEKEAQRQAFIFEESVKRGQINKAVKFEEFALEWFKEVGALKLKQRTLANYRNYSKRVFKAIGHQRMDRLTSRDVQKLIAEMNEGARLDKYKKGKLAPKTIRNHVAFISTIFEHGIRMGIVSHNPCKAVTLPKDERTEKEIYTLEEIQKILALLHQEPDKHFDFIVFFTLAIYCGHRRGEILGLENRDFDYERSTVTINRTSNYTNELGTFTDSPKTKNSYRTLKLPLEIMELVARYREHQRKYAESIGDKWVTEIEGYKGEIVPNDRLFTQWQGLPMHPNAPGLFWERFCVKHGIRYLNPHQMRHFNASAQIFAGVDLKTISSNLGHSTAQTTLTFYSHVFAAANAASMDKMIELVGLPEMKGAKVSRQSEEDNLGEAG